MAQDHLGPSTSIRTHFAKDHKAMLLMNFKHLSQLVLNKKIFEYFSMYFFGSNLKPLVRGHLGSWDLHLNKIGKGPLGNATNQISSI